jgi:molecular chaperone GrpE (heat shock protein)
MAMDEVATDSDEFATAMQQLSAEAEKTLPVGQGFLVSEGGAAGNHAPTRELGARLQELERALADRLDKLASDIATKPSEFAQRFQKIDQQLEAIRSTESVNKQLFDSLHAELLKYRDNFLHESLQKPFIHDLVLLYDDLNGLSEQLRTAPEGRGSKRGRVAQWRDNLENAIQSLLEILHRFDVMEIEPRERLDRSYHKVISYEPAEIPEEDGRIVMRVKRGFLWRGRLVRPEEVIAKRFG